MSSSSTVQLQIQINHENLYDLLSTLSPLNSDTVEGPASDSTSVELIKSWEVKSKSKSKSHCD
jgi:hypothetical protein